jgi:ribonuclease VapC
LVIFVDASALVSILAEESDDKELTSRLEGERDIVTSAIAVWESNAALYFGFQFSAVAARSYTAALMQKFGIRYVAIDEAVADLAIAAYEKYGKGRHRAALNMGDCFAYACAKANGAKLLYKGGDFALTDVDAA